MLPVRETGGSLGTENSSTAYLAEIRNPSAPVHPGNLLMVHLSCARQLAVDSSLRLHAYIRTRRMDLAYRCNDLLLMVHLLSYRGWRSPSSWRMDLSNQSKTETPRVPSNGVLCGACLQ